MRHSEAFACMRVNVRLSLVCAVNAHKRRQYSTFLTIEQALMMTHAYTLQIMRMGTRSNAHGAASGRSGTAPCLHLHRTFAADPTPKHATTGRCGSCKEAGGKGTHGTASDGRNQGCWA